MDIFLEIVVDLDNKGLCNWVEMLQFLLTKNDFRKNGKIGISYEGNLARVISGFPSLNLKDVVVINFADL